MSSTDALSPRDAFDENRPLSANTVDTIIWLARKDEALTAAEVELDQVRAGLSELADAASTAVRTFYVGPITGANLEPALRELNETLAKLAPLLSDSRIDPTEAPDA